MIKAAAVIGIAIALGGCARNPEQKAARYLESGKKYLEKKDFSRAALEFRNAMQADPKNAEAYYQLALVSFASGDVRNGIALLRKTTELNPKHKSAQLNLAQLMTASQSKEVVEEAEKRVLDVLANSPGSTDALNTLAMAEWRLGKAEDAEVHLRQILESSPQNLRASFNLARMKLSKKDVAGAEDVLKKAVEASPYTKDTLFALAAFYTMTARPAEAEELYRRVLKLEAKNGLALVSLAGIKLRAGQQQEAEELYKQAAAGNDPRYKPVHATYLFQTGKRDLAIAEFDKLSKAAPADRQARSRLVAAYLAAGRLEDADKVLDEALRKNAKDLEALLQRSQLHLRRGKYAEAQDDLGKFIRQEPNSAAAHYLLAKAYEGKRSVLRQREELGQTLKLEPGFLLARVEMAQLLLSMGAAKSGLELLNEAPAQQRNALPVMLQRNWLHLAMGNLAEAGQGIQTALGAARTPETLVQDGTYKLIQKDYARARTSAEEALKANPEELRALEIVVKSYAAQKQMPAALDRIREHARAHPKSTPVQAYLGQQLLNAGDRAGARKAFDTALSINPGWSRGQLALAQVDVSEGKLDAGRDRLTKVLSQEPSNLGAVLMIASLEERASKFTAAVEHYRKALTLDEQNIFALNNLAFLLVEYGNQPDEALQLAEKARGLAPESPFIQDTLGWIYYKKAQYPKAIEHLERAVSKEETAVRKAHLAVAYLKSGDRKRGMETMAAALKMDPSLQKSRLFQEVAGEIR